MQQQERTHQHSRVGSQLQMLVFSGSYIYNDSRSKVGCTVGTQAWGEGSHARSLPLTVSVAEVFSCPHTHEYSPASAMVRPWICSPHTAPSCLRTYLSPLCKVFGPFFHVTGAALLSSQLSVAVVPSVASSFFRLSLNLAGRAGEVRKTQT